MAESNLSIGEVVYNNGMPMVVIDCIDREDMSSMSYDRDYKLCSLEELEDKEIISQEDFEKLGYWVEIRGTKFPEIERVKDVAPFEIRVENVYKVRQKKAKTLTVYE